MNGGRSMVDDGRKKAKNTYGKSHSRSQKTKEIDRKADEEKERKKKEAENRRIQEEAERMDRAMRLANHAASEKHNFHAISREMSEILDEHGDEDFDAMLEQIDNDVRSRRKPREEIISQGRKAGYPEKLNDQLIVEVTKSIIPEIKHILLRKDKHVFRDSARKLSQGSKRPRLVMADLEFPPLGYYGQAGFALIVDTLPGSVDTMIDKIRKSEKWLGKFATSFLVLRLVIYPEIMARVVSREQKCSHNRAVEILHESDPYGMALFGDSQPPSVTVNLSSDDELSEKEDISIESVNKTPKKHDNRIEVEDNDDDEDDIPASYIPEVISSPVLSGDDDEIEQFLPPKNAKAEPAKEPRSSSYYFSDDDF